MAGAKRPRGIRHDRHCQRCRAERIKCDLNRPRCQPCQRTDQACHYPQRIVWMTERKASLIEPPASRTLQFPQNHRDRADRAPQHLHRDIPINLYGFIDLLSDLYREIQSSQQDLPDETIQLISRTLSFARTRLQGDNNKRAIKLHLEALTNLNKVIGSAHPIALFGIATFAIFEVCCGSFGAWHCHLHGARSLLDLHCRNKTDLDSLVERIQGLTDVLAYLVWFDVTGALVQDRALIFEDWHREILRSTFFDSVGCPPDAFYLYAQLAEQDINRGVLELSSLAMSQVLRLDGGDSTDRGLEGVVYRCAGAIVAFSRAGEDSSSTAHSSVVGSMVDRVCDAISSISVTSRFYVHMATPVYLVGMNATTASQCDALRAYWRNCRQSEFPRYPDAQEQSEQRWKSQVIG